MTPSIPATLHALVVDDDFLIRMEAIDILEHAGFQVLDAEHGGALKLTEADVEELFAPE